MNSIYVFALLSLALVAGAAAEGEKATVEQLCKLDKKAPEITTISELKVLIDQLKNGAECRDDVRDAILALEPVIELRNVCSEPAVNVMVDFWAKYVDKKSKSRKSLPKQLKRFFISYGLQVSKVCKQTMIAQLESATRETGVTEQDMKIVTRPFQESNKLQDIFGEQPKLEGLLMVVRADSAAVSAEERGKLSMPPKEKKYFEILQERCRNKFKPVYDSLILPIVRLAAIGINYKGKSVDEELASFREQQIYHDWFAAVIACEPALRHDAVMIPAEKITADGNTAIVTVLDEDDIAELKAETGLTLEEPSEITAPADYKVEADVHDLVVDTEDKYLTSSLQWYGKGLKDITKFKLSLAKRLPKLLKIALKSKKVQLGLKKKTRADAKKLEKYGGVRKNLERGRRVIVAGAGVLILGIIVAVPILISACAPLLPLWLIGGIALIVLVIIATPFVIEAWNNHITSDPRYNW